MPVCKGCDQSKPKQMQTFAITSHFQIEFEFKSRPVGVPCLVSFPTNDELKWAFAFVGMDLKTFSQMLVLWEIPIGLNCAMIVHENSIPDLVA